MDISVITVTWNSADFIEDQINSVILAAGQYSHECIVIDNASTDSTVAKVSAKFPSVHVVHNNRNLGFARANNQALSLVSGKYLAFVNPDIRLEPNCLASLVSCLEKDSSAAIAGPLFQNSQGQVEAVALPRRFPRLSDIIIQLFKLHHIFPRLLAKYLYAGLKWDQPQIVDSVRGSCMVVRRELVEHLGWAFDERYFLWFEDVDLCREARRRGYTVHFVPSARAVDHVGQSFKKANHLRRQKQFYRSAATYFAKWEGSLQAGVIRVLSPVGLALVWIYSKL